MQPSVPSAVQALAGAVGTREFGFAVSRPSDEPRFEFMSQIRNAADTPFSLGKCCGSRASPALSAEPAH
jgi:hypothetical protein